MITEKEKEFIYTHWSVNKYLNPHTYGESLTKANPETYLSMYRGATFIQYNFSYLSVKSTDNIKESKLYSEIYIPFLYKNIADWCNFLYQYFLHLNIERVVQLKKFTIYEYELFIMQQPELLRKLITQCLSDTENNCERVYTL